MRILVFCLFLSAILGLPFALSAAEPKSTHPVVKASVLRAFSVQDRVAVLIKLKDPSISSPGRLDSITSINRLQSKFKAAFSRETITGGMKINRKMLRIPWISARISQGVLEKLRHHDLVAVIEEDVPIYALLAESALLIHGDRSYHTGYTGMGVNVAVLDSGIDTDHPDLVDSVVWEECFLSDDHCPVTGTDRASGPGSAEDDNGHGSHVSGIITSDYETYRGIAPGAGIVAIKILDGGGNGNLSDLVAALDWVADNHLAYQIRIVNMSLGSFVYAGVCDDENLSLAEAADAVKAAGVVLFAASGNDGSDDGLDSPACLSSVISVGAVYDADVDERSYSGTCTDWTTAPDQIACFSNVSAFLDLLAPGARITSSYLNGGTTVKAGTSMACPHAGGMAALLLEEYPSLTPDDLLSLMSASGKPIYDGRIELWFPRIDIAAALGIDSPDLDGDGDVDGRDLATLAGSSVMMDVGAFVLDFGRAGQ